MVAQDNPGYLALHVASRYREGPERLRNSSNMCFELYLKAQFSKRTDSLAIKSRLFGGFANDLSIT